MTLDPQLLKRLKSCTWFTATEKTLLESPAQLWVFVLLGFERRTFDYLVITPAKLLEHLKKVAPDHASSNPSRPYQIYIWVTQNGRAWLTRGLKKAEQESVATNTFVNANRDLTPYLNDWRLITDL